MSIGRLQRTAACNISSTRLYCRNCTVSDHAGADEGAMQLRDRVHCRSALMTSHSVPSCPSHQCRVMEPVCPWRGRRGKLCKHNHASTLGNNGPDMLLSSQLCCSPLVLCYTVAFVYLSG